MKNIFQNKAVIFAIIILLLIAAFAGYYFVKSVNSTVYVDQAQISAPSVNLTSINGGILKETFVNEGEILAPNTLIARVDKEIIKTRSGGELIKLNGGIGRNVIKGETVATIINPGELKVVGQVPENKGLEFIHAGQSAYFTVDAYGSKKFYGMVDEVSPAASVGALTFNISDKRTVQNFDVKISFNINDYPELKNGMSAKIWVIK